jgi:hypothetical protein
MWKTICVHIVESWLYLIFSSASNWDGGVSGIKESTVLMPVMFSELNTTVFLRQPNF